MAFQPLDVHRPNSPLQLDRKAGTFFDDQDTLDGSILGSSLMSPSSPTQRDTFTNSSAMFSPESLFEDFPTTNFMERPQNTNNPFFEQPNNNNPFTRLGASEAATYGQQPAPWPLHTTATDSFNPSAAAFAQDFDSGPPSAFMPVGSTPAFGAPVQNSVRPSSVFTPTQSATPRPLSPHTNKDWMAMHAAQEAESRPLPKRMRPNSPPRTYSPFPRRDGGIRKKNARFDIPAERSLANIDQLISQCTDEEQIKELKQQKRLLRNRQAALDSRQRKKKHTEELEEEKKMWTEKYQQLEDEIANLRLTCDTLITEKEQLMHQNIEARSTIEQMKFEQEDMVRNHTLETGELRKKVSVLTERLEASSTPMAHAPSSASFNDFATDMDNLTMGPSEWDHFMFNDFCMDPENAHASQPQQQQTETTLVLAQRKKESTLVSEDKPVASGLLLMLLLCGAFVASKSSGNSAPSLPRMPDEVRAASATVLENIYKDAGVAPSGTSHVVIANRVSELHEPAPSRAVNWASKNTLPGTDFNGMVSGSNLDQIQAQLAGPTKDQENEQLFSITPSQYNSMTSADFTRRIYPLSDSEMSSDGLSPGSQPSHRRNLAETLAAMREETKGETAAEVYTRSLLWDKIPTEVVREFKRMVEESNAGASSESAGRESKMVKTEG